MAEAHPPGHSEADLARRLRQQSLVANFGVFALRQEHEQFLLDEAARIAADGLETRFAKVLEYSRETNDFLLRAGVGWHPGVVGTARVEGDRNSPAGYALHTGAPVVSHNLSEESRFRMPALLVEHGIQSAINVIVRGEGEPFGVLETDSTYRDRFTAEDTDFLQALANTLGVAADKLSTRAALRDALTARDGLLQEKEALLLEKETLLQEKDLLMQEIHHRVKNSLQMVQTLLLLQARAASGGEAERLHEAAGRILTIGSMHRLLYQGSSVTGADAATYLAALMDAMRDSFTGEARERPIVLDAEPMTLPAERLTRLGLVASELVTNALKYGAGTVRVRVRTESEAIHVRVEDEGAGFPEAFDPHRARGLGMRVVAGFARDRASLRIDRSVPFTRIEVALKD